MELKVVRALKIENQELKNWKRRSAIQGTEVLPWKKEVLEERKRHVRTEATGGKILLTRRKKTLT
jgi:hypothetical protein